MWSLSFCVVLALAGASLATECGDKTCVASLFVKAECDKTATPNSCKCKDATYQAISTGCGVKTELDKKPVIVLKKRGDGDEEFGTYSGEVLSGQEVVLRCRAASDGVYAPTANAKYEWKVDGTVDATKTDQDMDVTVAASAKYACKILDVPNFESGESAEYSITMYEAAGTIGQQPKVTVSVTGEMTAEAPLTFTCGNLPVDSEAITYTWQANGANVAAKTTKTVPYDSRTQAAAEMTSAITCKIAVGTRTVTTDTSTAVELPTQVAAKPKLKLSPGSVTVAKGTQSQVTCGVDGVTVKDAPVTGGNQDISTLNAGDTTYDCIGTDADNADQITVKVDDTIGARVDTSPVTAVDTGRSVLQCFVTLADNTPDITYSWTHADQVIVGQTDSTLQMNKLTDSYDGGYRCNVAQGNVRVATSAATALTTATDLAVPTVSAADGSTVFGLDTEYELVCSSASEVPEMTYEWTKIVLTVETKLGTAKTQKITADATATQYKCKTTVFGLNKESANPLEVEGKEILSVTVTNAALTSPVAGAAARDITYSCKAELRKGSAATPTYEWTGTAAGGLGTAQDAKISIAAAGDTDTIKCKVTAGTGNEDESQAVTYLAVDKPVKPQVVAVSGVLSDKDNNNFLIKGKQAVLSCSAAASDEEGATFVWTLGTNPIAGVTTQTYTIADAQDANKGEYKCKITIQGKDSDESDAYTVDLTEQAGRYCSFGVSQQCPTSGYYTGHCFKNRCQCSATGKVGVNECEKKANPPPITGGVPRPGGKDPTPARDDNTERPPTTTPKGSGVALVVSMATMFLALFVSRVF